MIYAVTARLIEDRAGEFARRLADGSIKAQEPDGREIVRAMARARLAPDGTVRWTETCYCETPLAHERRTVLDRYFSTIETEPVDTHADAHADPGGRTLMERLAAG